ncbi:MAG: serine/threonine protein kinase [Planctomycetes bacterium]|nr:serine/threonine protein kinase [Planctomycetota bacterium]
MAIKLLKPQFRQESRHVQEFMEEARRLFSLEHENIGGWKVFDRTPAGDWYFVMEFLQGQDLEAVLEREKRLDHRRVGQILVQTLRALEKAHFLSETEGILHLDLKPKNVFLVTGAGRYHEKVKVIDFGVGQLVRRRSATAEAGSPPVRGEAASASGTQQITGLTIDYASPEQLAYLLPEGARVPLDARSDLFSLGVMGFRMLTGEFPFDTKPPPPSEAAGFEKQAHTRKARMRMQVPCRTLDSTDVRVPRRLAAFLDRCLKLNRDERFPDSRAALAELEAIVDPPLLKRALGLAGVGALVAVVAAVVITRWLLPPTSHEFALLQNELELGADHPLFLGPAGATQVLGVDRGVLLDPALPLVLVESSLGGDLLPGWSVALVADGRLRITAPEDAVTGSRLVHVRQGELRSRNLRIVFLDPASWSVPTIQIDGWDSSRTIAPEES